jgi:hypothetical protein
VFQNQIPNPALISARAGRLGWPLDDHVSGEDRSLTLVAMYPPFWIFVNPMILRATHSMVALAGDLGLKSNDFQQ